MKRRILSVLISLCLLFCASLTFAEDPDDEDWGDEDWGDEELDEGFDEEEEDVDFRTMGGYDIETFENNGFRFELTDDGEGAILVSYYGTEAEVVFPEIVNDLPVVAIATAMCVDNSVIQSIQIPGCIKSIGANAFAKCQNLRTVIIEEGLTLLDKCCFGGCPELIEVQLPDSLEIVDDFAFANCAKLEEIVFGTQLQSIGKQAFLMCASLSKVTIPGGDAVQIGDQAFDLCSENIEILN